VGLQGGVLSIAGDRAGNAVVLQDHGTAGVQMTCDGRDAGTFTGVRSINAQLDGGNDRLDYFYADGHATPAPRSLTLDLGDGDDTLNVSIGNPDQRVPTALVNVTANGGRGNDTLTLQMQNVAIGDTDQFTLNGGDGADTLTLQVQNVTFNNPNQFTLNGENGTDTLNAQVQNVTFSDPRQAGNPNIFTLNGGAGADTFNVAFANVTVGASDPTAHVVVSLAGGDGGDTFNVSFASLALGNPNAFIGPNFRLGLDLSGDAGNDTANVRFVNVVWNNPEDKVAVNLRMGSGDDVANVSLGDPQEDFWDGHCDLLVDGQGGDDRLSVTINVSAASRGAINAQVLGGDGDDTLTLNVYANPDLYDNPDLFVALIDGGNGFDTASSTANVTVRNCEVVR
jgi:hypothetical protein